jgi:cell shape-determining protein MreD
MKSRQMEDLVNINLYFTGAFLVLIILLNAFLRDDTTPKTQIRSWIYLLIATILWPIILLSMIRKKLQTQASLKKSRVKYITRLRLRVKKRPRIVSEAGWRY